MIPHDVYARQYTQPGKVFHQLEKQDAMLRRRHAADGKRTQVIHEVVDPETRWRANPYAGNGKTPQRGEGDFPTM